MAQKVLILNGSPKGQYSITLQTALYIEKYFPSLEFKILNVGKSIRSIQADFSSSAELLGQADIILFCYPVYTFIVPCQLHRFIELIKENGIDLSGKVASQLSTSKHFYDTTAHRFIEDNCCDLGLSYIDGLSADMEDLLCEKGRKQAIDWFKLLLWKIEHEDFKKPKQFRYQPESLISPTEATATLKKDGRKVVIVADMSGTVQQKDRLQKMIDRFTATIPYKCDVIHIDEFGFKGGCTSCFSCAKTGRCIYPDRFDDFLRDNIHKHDAIIYAFAIRDHSMGSIFKTYDDRQFCNGHRTVTMGTPFGYLIDGEISQEDNLSTIIEARAQVGGNYLAGIASTENDPDRNINLLCDRICFALENNYTPPQNFYGVGGMKIFRDLIYKMRGLTRADHKFFKSHGQYDFPQKEWKTSMLMYLVGWMMNTPKIRAKMGDKINEGMIKKYKDVLNK